jgi:ribosomal subunit interface protein
MTLPVEITIRDIENTVTIDARIRRKVQKLSIFYDRIIRCRVAVNALQKNQHQGKLYNVHIEVVIPGKILIVNHPKNENLYIAIRDSFKAMERQLEDFVQKQRGERKNHHLQLTGRVVRLFPDYGFIETSEGEEYYFHETHVMQPEFIELNVGMIVRFIGDVAGDGLQAYQVSEA